MMENKARTKYQKVMLDLREKILTGTYPIDTKLPTEEELKKIYGVSRITVREAVNGLVSDGIVEKVQGKGSFVRELHHVKRLLKSNSIESFSKTAIKNGFKPKMEVLKLEKIKTNAELRDGLKCNSDYAIHSLRICYLDNDPTVIESNYYPLPRFEGLTNYDLSGSLYQVLKDNYGIDNLKDSESILRVVLADKEQARLLNRSVGFPLFYLRNQVFDNNKKVIQFGTEFIATDRYEFMI